GGGLQLQRRAGAAGGAGAAAGAGHIDPAAGGGDVILQHVALERQRGAGAGDQQLAVVGELAGGEVLDGVGGAVVGLEQAGDVQCAVVAAVDGGGLQLQRRAGAAGGAGAAAGAGHIDPAAGGGDVILQ